MIEHYAGAFPTWLSPVQMNIIPVNNEYHLEYAKKLRDRFKELDLRCELDDRDEKLGYKMRESQTNKIPYTLVLGDNEVNNEMITYRKHGEKESVTVSVEEFIKLINEEIMTKGVKE